MNTGYRIQDKKQLLAFLEQKGIMVTANRRAARSALGWYGKSQVRKGRSAWETPNILPLGAWMEKCASNSFYPDISQKPPPDAVKMDAVKKGGAVILSKVQERMIWEEIIEASAYGDRLFSTSALAARASATWALAHEWLIPLKRGPLWESGDPAAFLDWAGQFQRRCRQNGWIDHARLPRILGESFAAGRTAAPSAVCLSGFDEFSPAISRLFEILADRGTTIFIHELRASGGSAMRTGFPDAAAELSAVAQWARNNVESDPDLRTGIIVFDLAAQRNEVLRVFEEVCHPDAALRSSGHQDYAFNISYGRPLSDYPMVGAALLILSLGLDRFSITDWSKLLRSPFLSQSRSEIYARAAADAYLRERSGTLVSMHRMLSIFKPNGPRPALAFKTGLEKISGIVARFPDCQAPSKWAAAFVDMTAAFGWPGDRTLDSHEYQIMEAWQNALLQMGELDRVSPSGRGFETALSCFKQILSSTVFQPEQKDTPIQILGFLEAAGETFDRLWITGAHHERWPSSARPDPFLPVGLQRENNLPHCSPERERAYAKNITQRLLASAPEVCVSYPLSDGERPLFPSPLIAGLPEFSDKTLSGTAFFDYPKLLMASAAVESVRDVKGPPVARKGKVGGGTGVIKDQAACPFKAFSHYRLGARKIESPGPGLSAAERGILVHASLEQVWETLKDQATLLSMAPESLEKIVRAAVSSALADMARKRPDRLADRFGKIESIRLENLLFECLALEKERPAFTVTGTEQAMAVEIGGLRLSAIVDRIDRLEDGRIIIIDYKTGSPDIKSWMAERMTEPQLPLYSTVMKDPLAGVFFLQVRKGDCRYKGVCADDAVIPGGLVINGENSSSPGVKATPTASYDSIAALVQDWEQQLGMLAAEVLDGHAAVAPVEPARDCRYCDLKSLCRI